MKTNWIVLFTLIVINLSFSQKLPSEPLARKQLLLVHGLGTSERGHNENGCDAHSGSTSSTWFGPGLGSALFDSILPTPHSMFAQTFSEPGNTPRGELDVEFGYAENWQGCSDLSTGYFSRNTNRNLVYSKMSDPNYSVLENSIRAWFKTEYEFGVYRNGLVTSPLPIKSNILKEYKFTGNFNFASDEKLFNSLADGTSEFEFFNPVLRKWIDNHDLQKFDFERLLKKLRIERPDLIPSKYLILSHSMGGLTAREYIQGDRYEGQIEKLITFDTPHQGAGVTNQVSKALNHQNVTENIAPLASNSLMGLGLYLVGHKELGYRLLASTFANNALMPSANLVLNYLDVNTKGHTNFDDAIPYLHVNSDPLQDLNQRGLSTNYPSPAYRVFHMSGTPTFSNPDDQMSSPFLRGVQGLLPFPAISYLEGIYRQAGASDVNGFQDYGNGMFSGLTLQLGVSTLDNGTLLVPKESSKGEDVSEFNNPENDVKRKLYKIDMEGPACIGTAVLAGEATNVALWYSLSLAVPDHLTRALISSGVGLGITATGFAMCEQDWGSEFTSDVLGSHDYATANAWKTQSINIDGTDLEEFIYEKPWVSFQTVNNGNGVVPKIFYDEITNSKNILSKNDIHQLSDVCIGRENYDDCVKLSSEELIETYYTSNFEFSKIKEYSFNNPSQNIPLKSEIYQKIQCENDQRCNQRYSCIEDDCSDVLGCSAGDEGCLLTSTKEAAWPTNRMSSWYDVPGILLKDTPKEMHFTVDDARPDILKEVEVTINFSESFTWHFDDVTNSCSINYKGSFGADKTEENFECFSDMWGNAIVRFDQLAGIILPTLKSNAFFLDGQNMMSIRIKNNVGIENTQRIAFLKQAVPPRLDLIWPKQNVTLNNSNLDIELYLDLIKYPGLTTGKSELCLKSDNESGCVFENFSNIAVEKILDLEGSSIKDYYKLTKNKQINLANSELIFKVGSQSVDGQNGKTFFLSSSIYIDEENPSIFEVDFNSRVSVHQNHIASINISDNNKVLLNIARIKDANNKIVKEFPVEIAPLNELNKYIWDGTSDQCEDKKCVDGEYKLEIYSMDYSVNSKESYENIFQKLIDTSESASIIGIFESSILPLKENWNITEYEKLFTLKNHSNFDYTTSIIENSENLSFNRDRILNDSEKLSLELVFNNSSQINQEETFKVNLELSNLDETNSYTYLHENNTDNNSLLLNIEPEELKFKDGEYLVKIKVEDSFGNSVGQEYSNTITIDRTKPLFTNVHSSSYVFRQNQTNAQVNFQSNEMAICNIEYNLGESKILEDHIASPSNTFSFLINSELLTPEKFGKWNYSISCIDNVGNSSVHQGQFLVGVRPSKITSPSKLQNVSQKELLIFSTLFNPNPFLNNKTIDYRFSWRSDINPEWNYSGFENVKGQNNSYENEWLGISSEVENTPLVFFNTDEMNFNQIESFWLQIETQSCIDKELGLCDLAKDSILLNYHPFESQNDWEIEFDPILSAYDPGTAINFNFNIDDDLINEINPTYNMNLVISNSQNEILHQSNTITNNTSFFGAPSNFVPGISVWHDNNQWSLNYTPLSLSTQVKKLSIESNQQFSDQILDGVTLEPDFIIVNYASNKLLRCPNYSTSSYLECKGTQPTIINKKDFKLFSHQIQLKLSISDQATIENLGSFDDGAMTVSLYVDPQKLNDLNIPISHDEKIIYDSQFPISNIYYGKHSDLMISKHTNFPIDLKMSKGLFWNGLTQVGSTYPEPGNLNIEILVNELNNPSDFKRINFDLTINSVEPEVTSLVSDKDILYIDPAASNVLESILFNFELTNKSTNIEAKLYKDGVEYLNLGRKDYQAQKDVFQEIIWDGSVNGGDQLALEGKYELRLYDTKNTKSLLALTSFEIKLTNWVLATEDESSAEGGSLSFSFLEEQVINGKSYVNTSNDFLVTADLSGKIHSEQPISYSLDLLGKQKIFPLPTERSTVVLRKQRDAVELTVLVGATVSGWKYSSDIYYDCHSNGYKFLYLSKRKMIFEKGKENQIYFGTENLPNNYAIADDGRTGSDRTKTNDINFFVIALPANYQASSEAATLIDQLNGEDIKRFSYNSTSDFTGAMEKIRAIAVEGFTMYETGPLANSTTVHSILANEYPQITCDINNDENCIKDLAAPNNVLFNVEVEATQNSILNRRGNSDHWANGCGEHSNEYGMNIRANLNIKIPTGQNKYWNPPWGYKNLVTSVLRVDPYSSDWIGTSTDGKLTINPHSNISFPITFDQNFKYEGNNNNFPWSYNETIKGQFHTPIGNNNKFQEFNLYQILNGHKDKLLTFNNKDNNGISATTQLTHHNQQLVGEIQLNVSEKYVAANSVEIDFPIDLSDVKSQAEQFRTICNPTDNTQSNLQTDCYELPQIGSGVNYSIGGNNSNLTLTYNALGYLQPNPNYLNDLSSIGVSPYGKFESKCVVNSKLDNYLNEVAFLEHSNEYISEDLKLSCLDIPDNAVMKEKWIRLDPNTPDFQKIFVNGVQLNSAGKSVSFDEPIKISRVRSDNDLIDWNMSMDENFSKSKSSIEYPNYSLNPKPVGVFNRASNFMSLNDLKISSNKEFSFPLVDILKTNYKAYNPTENSLFDATNQYNPRLAKLSFENLLILNPDKSINTNLVGSVQPDNSIKIVKDINSSERLDEWVTLLTSEFWPNAAVHLVNNQKVVKLSDIKHKENENIWGNPDVKKESKIEVDGKEYFVLGYINISKLNGNTTLYLTKTEGNISWYRQFDVLVGEAFIGNDKTIHSSFGNISVFLPSSSYSSKETPVTIRTIAPEEVSFLAQRNVSNFGPIVEIKPSFDFCGDDVINCEQPQINLEITKSELVIGDDNFKNPWQISIYKVTPDGLSQLNNITRSFYENGQVCSVDQSQTILCDWDTMLISGTTPTFSTFGLFDKSQVNHINFDFDIFTDNVNPLIQHFKIFGLEDFEIYLDDDALFMSEADLSPPILLNKNISSNENGMSKGHFTLEDLLNGFITVVPVNSIGEELEYGFKTREINLLTNQDLNYVGDDEIWFGSHNGFSQFDIGNFESENIILSIRDITTNEVINKSFIGGPIILSHKEFNPLFKEYSSTITSYSTTGFNKQIPGPKLKIDPASPVIEGSIHYDTDIDYLKIYPNISAEDFESEIKKILVQVVLANKLISSNTYTGNELPSQITIDSDKFNDCIGCEALINIYAYDLGNNFALKSYKINNLYAHPLDLIAYFPLNEGFGTTLHDLGPSESNIDIQNHNKLWLNERLDLSLPNSISSFEYTLLKENLSFSLNLKSDYTNGNSTLLTILENNENVLILSRIKNDLAVSTKENQYILENFFSSTFNWDNIILSSNEGQLSFYRNGNLVKSIDFNQDFSNTQLAFVIGNFKGTIDNLLIFNRKLTQNQIDKIITEKSIDLSNEILVELENYQNEDFLTEINCEVSSGYTLKSQSDNSLSTFNIIIPTSGFYGVGAKMKGTGVVSINVSNNNFNINVDSKDDWQKTWGISNNETKVYLEKGVNQVEVNSSKGINIDWIKFSENTEISLEYTAENHIQQVDSLISIEFKPEPSDWSQYGKFRIKITNTSAKDIIGYKFRYYFNDSAPIISPEVWEKEGELSFEISNSEIVKYIEFTSNEILKAGESTVDGRGIYIALRPQTSPADYTSKWNFENDPSWVGPYNTWNLNAKISAFDLRNQPLNTLYCPSPENYEFNKSVFVVSKEGKLSDDYGSNPQFRIESNGTEPISNPILEYYFTVSEPYTPNVSAWNVVWGTGWDVAYKGDGNYVLSVEYKTSLNPGDATDWGNFASFLLKLPDNNGMKAWNKSDDYSNNHSSIAQINVKIVVKEGSTLLWGVPPEWAMSQVDSNKGTKISYNSLTGQINLDLEESAFIEILAIDISGNELGNIYTGTLLSGENNILIDQSINENFTLHRIVVYMNGTLMLEELK